MNVDPMGSVTTCSYSREIKVAVSAGSLVISEQIRAQIPEMSEPIPLRNQSPERLLRYERPS